LDGETTTHDYRWLFLVNAIFVWLASLPLLLAYERVFTALGIVSLENGFFVRLSAAWLFTEGIASYLTWRRPRGNSDLVLVIIAMKVAFILMVLLAAIAGSLPAQGFWVGAAIDLAFSIAFAFYLSAQPRPSSR
jgi:hypothetical protein